MQFKDIKQGQPVFMLDKSSMELKQGKVINNAFHTESMNTYTGSVYTQQNNTLCRDITIEVKGKSSIYVIPEQLETTKAGNIILSTGQDALIKELNILQEDAKEKLASRDYYQMVVDKTPDLLVTLNPSLKKEQETEKRLKAVENSVGEVRDSVGEVRNLIKTLVDKLS